jgi:hypothetical protein
MLPVGGWFDLGEAGVAERLADWRGVDVPVPREARIGEAVR